MAQVKDRNPNQQFLEHRILCIEVPQKTMRVLKAQFSKSQFTVLEEKNIQKALKKISHQDIAVVLLNQDAFKKESFEVTQKLVACVTHPAVIVLTKDDTAQNIRDLFNLKISDCLTQPVALSTLIQSIKSGITYRESSLYGIRDLLTGLYNRYAFKEILQRETDRARRYQRHLSLLMVDIDYFKKINDTYGHLVGDHVLEEVSDVLRSAVRKIDVISRFGGEEFAILLPETTIGHATLLAERIRKKIEAYDYTHLIGDLRLTVSVGISNFHTPGQKSDVVLLNAADQALYAAKKEGRNKVCISVPKEILRASRSE
ncbi:MAG: hypothetical protein A3B70_06355 [Deltaproteobacteria bacterium RIFCSPHIGHO2_02_FULL_40_11]|nr:MAG: hypothetical protein A3B70_06355 [Deltaproteobacteria bacterium RIFCSPHIGHO2_02_FULL_40_11]